MLLAIDVGNTQTVFGLFDGDVLTEQFRVGTNRAHTGDELAVMLRAFVELELLAGIVLAWSRSMGELGATIIFAGNLQGRTQTMPLAIIQAFVLFVIAAEAIVRSLTKRRGRKPVEAIA